MQAQLNHASVLSHFASKVHKRLQVMRNSLAGLKFILDDNDFDSDEDMPEIADVLQDNRGLCRAKRHNACNESVGRYELLLSQGNEAFKRRTRHSIHEFKSLVTILKPKLRQFGRAIRPRVLSRTASFSPHNKPKARQNLLSIENRVLQVNVLALD